jgi:threonine dehydrogenase-like Zn-dependent dehydrogenase
MVSYGFMETGFDLGVSGAFADHLYLHPNTLVHRISPTLPASVAVMFNPLGAGVRWSYQVPDLGLGDTVVVLGAGQRGLCCVIAARAAGAGLIIVSDIAAAQHKLDLARDLGADAVGVADEEDLRQRVTELTGGRLADLVINVASGAPELVADAINLVRNGGTIVLAGLTGGQAVPQFISDKLVLRSITLRGVFAVDTAAYRHAIRLLESGDPVIARMHSRSYGLAEAEQAILHHAGRLDAPPAVHLALTPGAGR